MITREEWVRELLKLGVFASSVVRRPDENVYVVTLMSPRPHPYDTGAVIGTASNSDLVLAEEEALGDLRAKLADAYSDQYPAGPRDDADAYRNETKGA